MIRVTNRTRDIVTLPAPYQGILMAYRSEVLDTTEAEFVAAIGGLDTAGGVFTIEAVAASVAATVTVDRNITDADLIYAIPNADTTYYAVTTNIQVNASSFFGPNTVVMTNPDGSDLEEGVIYTIKDTGGDASNYNITVSTPYTVVGGSGNDYIIETDYASVGFYRSGSSFVPLPGVSSGGGAVELVVQKFSTGPASISSSNIPDVALVDTLTNTAAITLTMPALGLTSKIIRVVDESQSAATYNVTIEVEPGDLGSKFGGANGTSTLTLNTNGQSYSLVPYLSHWYTT